MKMDYKDFPEAVCGDNNKKGEGQFIGNTVSSENRNHPQQSGRTGPSIECRTQEHKSTTSKFVCQFCKESLPSFYNLHLHLKKVHKATIKLTCNLCGETFQKHPELINHLEAHQNDPAKSRSHSSKSKPKTKTENSIYNSKSKPKPKAKHAKRTRKNTNKTEKQPENAETDKSTSSAKGKRKGCTTLKKQTKKSRIDEATEISSSPSDDLDKLSAVLELHPPPVSSSLPLPVPVLESSPKSPPAPDLQENSVFEDYFEPLSPKLEVFDDWDGEDDVFNSVDVDSSSTHCSVWENLSSFSFPFQCSKCDLQFRGNHLLEIHQSFHNLLILVKFRCEVPSCFQYFDDAVEYQKHFTSTSTSHTNNRNRRSRKREAYRSAVELKQYSRQRHRHPSEAQKNGAASPSRREDAGPNRLLCSLCPTEFETKAALEKHQGVAHGIKPFPCPQCDRKYMTRRARRDHVRNTHSTVTPCYFCGGHFPTAEVLEGHKQMRHANAKDPRKKGERIVCHACGKSFCSARDLRSHMDRHNGVILICDECGKPCKSAPELRLHQNTH